MSGVWISGSSQSCVTSNKNTTVEKHQIRIWSPTLVKMKSIRVSGIYYPRNLSDSSAGSISIYVVSGQDHCIHKKGFSWSIFQGNLDAIHGTSIGFPQNRSWKFISSSQSEMKTVAPARQCRTRQTSTRAISKLCCCREAGWKISVTFWDSAWHMICRDTMRYWTLERKYMLDTDR